MNCPHCNEKISIHVTKHKDYYRGNEAIGRPRLVAKENIIALRKKGFSFSAIAKELKISKGSVQYALSIEGENE